MSAVSAGVRSADERPAIAANIVREAPSAMEGTRWFVAQTRSHCERQAVENLERQSFRAFYPRLRKTARHARRTTTAQAALFPNYVFVALDASIDAWRSINGTRGVVRLITQGEIPLPVPYGIVEGLLARTGTDGVLERDLPAVAIGQSVRVTYGPFEDLIGTLQHLDAGGRAHVLLQLMGRSVSVGLHYDAIWPAG